MDFDRDILFPDAPDASELIVACGRRDYSASVIARAVEDCDAHILNLNVLGDTVAGELLHVALRIDRRNAAGVARSLERFGYEVLEVRSPEEHDPDVEQARDRANELLRYIEI